MPLIDIHFIESVFNETEKQNMINTVTDTMAAIEGETMRSVTWVRIHDVPVGSGGSAVKPLPLTMSKRCNPVAKPS